MYFVGDTGIGIVVLAALVVLGVVLVVWGLRGRRVGGELRCGKCGYELTGSVSCVCPECGLRVFRAVAVEGGDAERRGRGDGAVADSGEGDGAGLSGCVGQCGEIAGIGEVEAEPGAVVVGVRCRRWGPVIVGGLLIAIVVAVPASIGGKLLGQSGLYPCYPLGMLVDAAQTGSGQALNELDRRIVAGKLSDSQYRIIADAALEEQGRDVADVNTQKWVDWLADLDSIQKLSPEQVERVHAQMFRWSLRVRSPIKAGDLWPAQIAGEKRRPSGSQLAGLGGPCRIWVDDQLVYEGEFGSSYCTNGGIGAWASMDMRPNSDGFVPGEHVVRCVLEESLHSDFWCPGDGVPAISERTIQICSKVEVLGPNDVDPVRYLDSHSCSPGRLRESLVVREIRLDRNMSDDGSVRPVANFPIMVRSSPPVSFAFDLVIRSSAGEVIAGEFTGLDGRWFRISGGHEVGEFEDETVTVILRSNLDLARESLDLFEIWEGELVFESVLVKRSWR